MITLQEFADVHIFGNTYYEPVELPRIGSDKNCTALYVPNNAHIREAVIWGDGAHVAGLGFLDSTNKKYYYGSNFRGDSEYDKVEFHFFDTNRLIGAFGQTIHKNG